MNKNTGINIDKNKKIKKVVKNMFIGTLIGGTILCSVGCGKEEPLSSLEAIQKQLIGMENYYCKATLTRVSNKGDSTYETEQYVNIKTGQYKLELTLPVEVAGNYTVFDGERICQYNPKINSKVIHDVPYSKSRNELFLNSFLENYVTSKDVEVTVGAIDDSDCVVLEAIITGTDSSLSYEKLWVSSETLEPIRLSLYSSNDEEMYRIEYNEFIYNDDFSDDIFIIQE